MQPLSSPVLAQVQALLTDPEINPNDTYVVFDADFSTTTTVDLASPIVDPATGQQVSSLTFSDTIGTSYSIEAGYAAAAVLRATLTGTWSPTADPLAVSTPDYYRLVVSNGVLYEYAADGTPLSAPVQLTDSTGNAAPAATAPLDLLGSDLLYGDIVAGVVSDSDPGPVTPQASRRASESRVTAAHVLDRVVHRAQSEGGMGNRQRHQRFRKQGSKWVLEESSMDNDTTMNGTHFHTTSRLTLGNVRWNRNDVEDRKRR